MDKARSMQGCAAHQQYREPLFLLQDKIFVASFQASAAASMRIYLSGLLRCVKTQKKEDLNLFTIFYCLL